MIARLRASLETITVIFVAQVSSRSKHGFLSPGSFLWFSTLREWVGFLGGRYPYPGIMFIHLGCKGKLAI